MELKRSINFKCNSSCLIKNIPSNLIRVWIKRENYQNSTVYILDN